MVSELTRLMTFTVKYGAPLINQRLRARVLMLILALACAATTGPAFARTVFDGDWSVLIVTHGGACDPAYRYGVRITDGTVINDGSSAAAVQGRVNPAGGVMVTVRSGNQWADGSGRLSSNRGGGVWKGQSSSGSCSGAWEAERRD
jgi:hypothetical protein